MMKWVKGLVPGPIGKAAVSAAQKRPKLTRQEMSDLFSDELARPVLQKRTKARHQRPRRLMAGRRLQFV